MEARTMTTIQQVCFVLDGDYHGHPYFVTGSALVHAITSANDRLSNTRLSSSVGVFVPGAYGVYPEHHSKGGISPSLGSTLPAVNDYEDVFLFRRESHPWMLSSRPAAATNTHDLRLHGDELVYAPEKTFGTDPDAYHNRRTVRWYVHAFLHSPDQGVLPLSEADLSGLSVGGSRNYGYGQLSYVDSQLVDLQDLDYSSLADSDRYCLELCSPYVLESSYPGVSANGVPWWWRATRDELRTRRTRFVEHGEEYTLTTADHGQLVEYTGSDPVRTAINGITGVGAHSKYGFGEFHVIPTS